MGAVFAIVADVLVHQALEGPFISNDYVVEQISPAIAHEAFRHPILPWATHRRANRDDTQILGGLQNLTLETCVRDLRSDTVARNRREMPLEVAARPKRSSDAA
jgi:hypothetical protein